MKIFSKILSVLLTLTFVFASVVMFNVGANAAVYSGSYDEGYIDPYTTPETTYWEFNDSTNTMTFSGGGSVEYEAISSYADKAENIVIKAGVQGSSYNLVKFKNLKSIQVDANHENYKSIDGVLFDKDQTTLCCYPSQKNGSTYIIPDGVVEIADGAFKDCTELTYIKIPDTVREVFLDTFENSGCWNTSSNWDGNVLYIDDCLVDVAIDRGGVSGYYNVRPGTRMILSNSFLSSFNDKLTGLSIPDTVNYIAPGTAGIPGGLANNEAYWYEGACYVDNCLIDVNVDLSGHLKIKEGTRLIVEGALRGCDNLATITIPGSVKSIPSLKSTLSSADKTITDIYINEGVEIIEYRAFYNLGGLKNVSFPKSLKKIDTNCFGVFSGEDYYFSNQYVYDIIFSYAGTVADWNKIEIVDNSGDFMTKATIHCTDGIINEIAEETVAQQQTTVSTVVGRTGLPLIPIALVTIIFIIIAVIIIKKSKNKKGEYKTLSK